MDAVELPYPVDVAPASICKLMGSDGFGRAVAKLKEVGQCDLDRDPVVSNGWCSSSHGDKDEAIAINASECIFQGKTAAIKCFRRTDQLPSFSSEELSQNSFIRDKKAFLHSGPQESNLQCKAGRVARSVGKFSKRGRIIQDEETSRVSDACEIRDLSDKCLTKSESLDGNQSGRQKNAATKRNEKRSSKFHMRARFDSSPMKSGSAVPNVSSSTNALGFYGLKTDIQDFTKLVDDLSLNDILEGSCQCPSRGKEKGKKTAYLNDNIMQSVRKACTMLQPSRPGKSPNLAELDNSKDQTIASLFSCMSVKQSGIDGDSRDSCTANVSSLQEVSVRKSEVAINRHESTLYSPKDLLERLSLPFPKDLESLLNDASKPISASKSASDLHLVKQVAKHGGMPSFPWSHAFNGHFRSNPDAVKMTVGRGSFCPGKWSKMKNPTNLLGSPSDGFTSLDSITYDQSLIPETKVTEPRSSLVPSVKWTLSSSACSFVSGEQNAEIEDQQQADRSCSILGAARTLCDMVAGTSGKTKSLHKRPPMRPRLKPETSTRPSLMSEHTSDDPDNKIFLTKKPKLSRTDKCFSKAPITWSAPKSSRTCPGVRFHPVSSVMKQRGDNHQKSRKPVLPDWNRDGFR